MKILILLSLIYLINFSNSKKSCSSLDENECAKNKEECFLSKVSSCCGKDYFECLQIPHKYCSPEELVPLLNNKLSINQINEDENLLDEKQIISKNNHEWCLKKKNLILRFNSSCVPESNNDHDYFKPNKYKCKFTKCLKGFKCIDNDHNEFHKKCDSLTNSCCSYQSKCVPTKDAHPLDIPITKKPKGNELKDLIVRNLNYQNLEFKENHNGQNENSHHKKKKSNKQNEEVELANHNKKHDNHHKKKSNNHSSNQNHHNNSNNHVQNKNNSSEVINNNSNNNNHNIHINNDNNAPSPFNNNNNNNNHNERVTLNPKIIFRDPKSNGQQINNNNNLNPKIIYRGQSNNNISGKRLLSIQDVQDIEDIEDIEDTQEDEKNKKNHKKDKHSKNKHKKNHNKKKKKNDKHKSNNTKAPNNTEKPTQSPAITQPVTETPQPVTETPQPVTETPTHTPSRPTTTPSNPCINALCPEGSTCIVRNGRPYCKISNFPSNLRNLKMLLNQDKNDKITQLNCQNLPCNSDEICYIINNSPVCKPKPPQKTTFYRKYCNDCPKDSSSCMPREDGKEGVVCTVKPITCGIVNCPEDHFCMDNTQDLNPNCYEKMNCSTLKPPIGYTCKNDDIRGAIFVKHRVIELSCETFACPQDQFCYEDNHSDPTCKPKPTQQLIFYKDSCLNCPDGTSVCGPREDGKEGVVCKIVPLTCGIIACPENQFCLDNGPSLEPTCLNKMDCENVISPSGYKCQPDSIRGGVYVKIK